MAAYVINPERPFYVYEHYKEDTNEIFYVGKGKNYRAWEGDEKRRGKYWWRIVKKHGLRVRIVAYFIHEIDATRMEVHLIAMHGRKDKKMGPLINHTDGGEGMSGHIQSKERRQITSESNRKRKVTQKTKDKMSAKAKGRVAHNKGKPMSENQKKKLRGPKTEEHKKNLSLSMQGDKHPLYDHTIYHFKNINGLETKCTRYEFIKTYNMAASNISNLVNKKAQTVKGWFIVGHGYIDTTDNNIYHFFNVNTNIEEKYTIRQFYKKYKIREGILKKLISGKGYHVKGWIIYGSTKKERRKGRGNVLGNKQELGIRKLRWKGTE